VKVVHLFPRAAHAADSEAPRTDSDSADRRPRAGLSEASAPTAYKIKIKRRRKLSPAAVIAKAIEPRSFPNTTGDPLNLLMRSLGWPQQRPAAPDVVREAPADAQFWQVWLSHREYLHRFSLRFSNGNAADAEDALSEAMLKAAAAFETTVVRNQRAWLLRLVHNACMDRHRGRRRQHRIVEEAGNEESGFFSFVAPQPDRSPEELLSAVQFVDELKQALAALPQSLAEPLQLYLEERSDAEIAAKLNVTKEVIRKRRQMARDWLRRKLAE